LVRSFSAAAARLRRPPQQPSDPDKQPPADRTPKQKLKMRVTQPELLTLFRK
jgi:hypothetical protein